MSEFQRLAMKFIIGIQMDNALLDVRNINRKYIAAERSPGMTFKELIENEKIKSEITEAVKSANPKNEAEYFKTIIAEAAERGVETNENEVRAYIVSKMPIDEEGMGKLSGGSIEIDIPKACTITSTCASIWDKGPVVCSGTDISDNLQ